jgi:hypothetical protein
MRHLAQPTSVALPLASNLWIDRLRRSPEQEPALPRETETLKTRDAREAAGTLIVRLSRYW